MKKHCQVNKWDLFFKKKKKKWNLNYIKPLAWDIFEGKPLAWDIVGQK